MLSVSPQTCPQLWWTSRGARASGGALDGHHTDKPSSLLGFLGGGLLGRSLGSLGCRRLGGLAGGGLGINGGLEGGASGELGQLGCGDLDLGAGAGVHAAAGSACVLLEGAETGDGQ